MWWNKDDNMIERARKLAYSAHKGQTRWGGEPFIVHPQGVVAKLQDMAIFGAWLNEIAVPSDYVPVPLNENEKQNYYIVGWLHDVVEDTDYTLGDLLDLGFDYDVVKAVDAITRRDEEDYREYILRVKKNAIARQVKMADIEHNLESFNTKKNKSRADKYRLAIEVLK